MRSVLILILACGLSGSPAAAATFDAAIFPAKPSSFKACYQAGQNWIRTQMRAMTPLEEQVPEDDFNTALAACTWRVPAAAKFKWPAPYQNLAQAPYVGMLAQSPNGDWVTASFNTEDSTPLTFLRVLKKTGAVQKFDSKATYGYFFGFDFATYNLATQYRTFGSQQASLDQGGSRLEAEIFWKLNDEPKSIFTGARERIGFDSENKSWFFKKCLIQVKPVFYNVLPNLIETCRAVEADDVDALRNPSKARAIPYEVNKLQWDGQNYTDETPYDWVLGIARDNLPPPDIVTTTKTSKILVRDTLQYQTMSRKRHPKGGVGFEVVEWFQILEGIDAKIASKINAAVLKRTRDDFSEKMEGEAQMDNGEPRAFYGETVAKATLMSFAKGLVLVRFDRSWFMPSTRMYDETAYGMYSATTGNIVPSSALFKSRRAMALFSDWVTRRFSDKFDNISVDGWRAKGTAIETSALTFLPTAGGIDVVVDSNDGGHYFASKVGYVAYTAIPAGWLANVGALATRTAPAAPAPSALPRRD